MYKISSLKIDYYDDSDMIYDLIKSASEASGSYLKPKDQASEMDDDSFALVMITKTGSKTRKYPIFDKAHTALSREAFNKTAALLPHEAAQVAASMIYESCVYEQIDCPDFITKLATDVDSNIVYVDESKVVTLGSVLEKAANDSLNFNIKESDYGLVVKTASGVKRMYPLNTKSNTLKAIDYFEKNANKILYPHVAEFAENITKKASSIGLSVPSSISKYASREKGDLLDLNILSRSHFVASDEEKRVVRDMVKCAKSMHKYDAIELVHAFDKSAGITKFYGAKLKDPHLTILEKSAELENSDHIRDIDIENFARAAQAQLAGKLPDDVIIEFVSNPVQSFQEMSDAQKQIIIDEINEGNHGM